MKNMLYRWNYKSAMEGGRTMLEMLSVLMIMGLLSVGGLYLYKKAMIQVAVNNVVDSIDQALVLLDSALPSEGFATPAAMNEFLKSYSRKAGPYEVAFHAPEDSFTGKEYVFEVKVSDDQTIDSAFCKKLITTLVSNKRISAIMLNTDESDEQMVAHSLVDVDAFCHR